MMMEEVFRCAERELREDRGIVVAVRELPDALQKALKSVGYNRRDISVKPSDKERLSSMGGDGYRAFAVIVNLETGRFEVEYGSWGGPNMFVSRPVDADDKLYAIPPNGAVILGSEGGGHPVYATISVNPRSIAPLLPTGADTTERQREILRLWGYISKYRAEEMKRMRVKPEEIDALVSLGMITKNKSGAMSITTKGKNEAQKAS